MISVRIDFNFPPMQTILYFRIMITVRIDFNFPPMLQILYFRRMIPTNHQENASNDANPLERSCNVKIIKALL
jgi:hypothetical protein